MLRILLLGAGFSRNWNGPLASEVFEYLIGCKEVAESELLKSLLWRKQESGGYEEAFADLQQFVAQDSDKYQREFQNLEAAVARVFADVNRGYSDQGWFEFQQDRERQVGTFLARFDAIFTLNQDLLLELHYFDNNVPLTSGKWQGAQMSGMQPLAVQGGGGQNSWAQRLWVPTDPLDTKINERIQPYYKMHGSSNWRTRDGGSLLITGGEKSQKIGLIPVLRWYSEMFSHALCRGDTRLMVVGYGFGDAHINKIIHDAVINHSLRFFVVDPKGADFGTPDTQSLSWRMGIRSTVQEMFESGLAGASRRPLSRIFGNDAIALRQVIQFIEG